MMTPIAMPAFAPPEREDCGDEVRSVYCREKIRVLIMLTEALATRVELVGPVEMVGGIRGRTGVL